MGVDDVTSRLQTPKNYNGASSRGPSSPGPGDLRIGESAQVSPRGFSRPAMDRWWWGMGPEGAKFGPCFAT